MRSNRWALMVWGLLMMTAMPAAAQLGLSEETSTDRAAWLMGRSSLETLALTGQRFEQSDIGTAGGGSTDAPEVPEVKTDQKGWAHGAWPVLFSLILPGAGEASMGYHRGYVMMAADIFAWTQVAKYNNEGDDKTDEYYAYADDHYSDQLLVEGYKPGSTDQERVGQGAIYFPTVGAINDTTELDNLPLYVTKEEDRREYYENLGKWDQFIFGWDDYTRASESGYPYPDYEPTLTRADLQNPWVSQNRDTYRLMRDDANDAYKSRDRWLYVNIGLRLFSVLQSAYLGGLLTGGDEGDKPLVYGHRVDLHAQPMGWDSGAVAASVSF